jgi:hypothetical protein
MCLAAVGFTSGALLNQKSAYALNATRSSSRSVWPSVPPRTGPGADDQESLSVEETHHR